MNRASARGFTLLEVLITVTLILALGGALFGFLHDMLATRQRTLEHAMQQRAATTLIERLEADAVATLVGARGQGPGVQGGPTHLRLMTRGVMTQLASRGLDEPGALGDLQTVEYRFDPATRRLEARKSAVTGDDAPAGTLLAALGGDVAHVRFRYFDGARWTDSFDSLAALHLPAAIEVAVWFHPWPQDRAAPADRSSTGDAPMESSPGGTGDVGRSPAAAFDERAHGMASDDEALDLPPPDRVRLIVVPDGGAPETAAASADQ